MKNHRSHRLYYYASTFYFRSTFGTTRILLEPGPDAGSMEDVLAGIEGFHLWSSVERLQTHVALLLVGDDWAPCFQLALD